MPLFSVLRDTLATAVVVGWVMLPVAAALDARRRCHARAAAWAALVGGLVLPYVGVLLYAAARPRETIDERRHRRTLERYLGAAVTDVAQPADPAEPARAEHSAPAPAPALIEHAAL